MTTILQISDPHLLSQAEGTLKGVPTSQSLQLVLEKARHECAEPARVVLSGDLSHEHTVSGYELLKSLLGDWSELSSLIPGNHDDRRGLRSVFAQVSGQGDDDVCFRDEIGDWQLIGLDSHEPGHVHGQLGDQSLEQLHDWLSADPRRPTLIFLHHPPIPVGSRWIDDLRLQNPDPLAELVESAPGVRGLFCGHIHQVFEGVFAGVPLQSAPSASFQFVPECDTLSFDLQPPGFRLIELNESDISTRVIRLDELPFTPRDD